MKVAADIGQDVPVEPAEHGVRIRAAERRAAWAERNSVLLRSSATSPDRPSGKLASSGSASRAGPLPVSHWGGQAAGPAGISRVMTTDATLVGADERTEPIRCVAGIADAVLVSARTPGYAGLCPAGYLRTVQYLARAIIIHAGYDFP